MRIKILMLLLLISSISFAQLKIANGEQLTIANGGMLYANEAVVNNGSLFLNTGRLMLANDFNNAGILNAASATIELVGGTTQSLTFGSNDIAKRVELNKSANTATVTAGKLTITDGLKSVAGSLNAGERVILQSTSAKTAIVEQSTAGTISNIVVERYIPAKRAFRLLSSPVTSTTSINYNWQENQNNTSDVYANNLNASSGYGTHIAGSISGANGFDATQSGNASLFLFDNATQNWSAVNNTNTNTLNAGGAYRLMVRGDRSIDMNTNAPTPTNTILRTRGALKIGTHTVTGLSATADAFNFLGNPYQSPVDIETVLTNSNNINPNFYYVWDPKVGGTNGRGAYVTYSFLTDTNNISGSAVDAYLQPMQACFVKTAANGVSSVVFQESNKFTTTNENVYRNASTQLPMLKLNLFDTASLQAGNTALDGVMCLFGTNFSNGLDAFEAEKLTNLDENLAVVVQNNKESIATYNEPTLSSIYPLSTTNYKHQDYVFTANLTNYTGLTPYLFDKFLATYTTIEDGMTYPFSLVATQPLSNAADRFEIVFANPTLAANDAELDQMIKVYPNPSKTGTFYCNIPANTGAIEVALFNELGQKIEINQVSIDPSKVQCNVQNTIMSGIYHIVITTTNGTKVVKKWAVN
ncbi:MAG: T9SS type A sorting domain-containing protein [Flavobacterium sp.]